MVELPDTASGSELPHGHHSTLIVFCFVLAENEKQQETKLSKAMANFLIIFRRSNNHIPVVW